MFVSERVKLRQLSETAVYSRDEYQDCDEEELQHLRGTCRFLLQNISSALQRQLSGSSDILVPRASYTASDPRIL